MYRIVGGILLLLLALPAAGAEDKPKDKPATPAEQYKALLKEYQDAAKETRTFADRLKLAQEQFGPKFLDLAEKNPKDPAAVDALLWVVNNVRAQGKDNPRAKALEALARDHGQSDKVGSLCQMLVYELDPRNEDFLRAVLDKNPSRDVQGQACLALGQYLKGRNDAARGLKDRPENARYYEATAGKEYLEQLKKLDPAKADKEVEEIFERAADKYGDVKLSTGGTIGAKVKPELFEIRNLAIGKTVPDVTGEDVDGKQLKLSDYRGKVVLLDFWGNW